jgi:hypothetical protein
MANGKCRMHGGRSPGARQRSPGAPRGERHPNFKTGKHSIEGKAVAKWAREMTMAAEALASVAARAHGLPMPELYRRKAHVKRAVRAYDAAKKAKAKGEQT